MLPNRSSTSEKIAIYSRNLTFCIILMSSVRFITPMFRSRRAMEASNGPRVLRPANFTAHIPNVESQTVLVRLLSWYYAKIKLKQRFSVYSTFIVTLSPHLVESAPIGFRTLLGCSFRLALWFLNINLLKTILKAVLIYDLGSVNSLHRFCPFESEALNRTEHFSAEVVCKPEISSLSIQAFLAAFVGHNDYFLK